jgi:hypothetical protein
MNHEMKANWTCVLQHKVGILDKRNMNTRYEPDTTENASV